MKLLKRKGIIVSVLLIALIVSTALAFGVSEEYSGNVTPGKRGSISAPQVTAVTTGRTSLHLKWKPVKGAKGYVIYRGTEMFEGTDFGATTYKKVKTLYGKEKTSFKNTGLAKDSRYYYEVFAFKYKNGQKVYSRTASVTAVTGVLEPYISVSAGSISSVDVYGNSEQADKIAVYRSKTEDGEFVKVLSSMEATFFGAIRM